MTETTMTVPEILAALTPYTGRFPEAAMKAAVEQREAITPELLRALEEVAADPPLFADRAKDNMLHTFALYLLAEFRERRAFPIIIRLISGPAKAVDDLLGDTVTEGLSCILASTYDGNLEALISVVLQHDAYPFVRSSVADAITLLYHESIISRDQMIAAFRRCFAELREDDDPQAWNGVVSSAADAQARELLPEIRQAFERGCVERFCVGAVEDIEEAMAEDSSRLLKRFRYHHHIVLSAVKEMSWWAAFSEDDGAARRRAPVLPDDFDSDLEEPVIPVVRETPKIGRNDPCPCGSGKKYKKCCLGKP